MHYITGLSLGRNWPDLFPAVPERQVSRMRSKALQRIGGMPRNKEPRRCVKYKILEIGV